MHLGVFPFKQEIYLKYELFLDHPIHIRFRSINNTKDPKDPKAEPGTPLPKAEPPQGKPNKKVKERDIKEAI